MAVHETFQLCDVIEKRLLFLIRYGMTRHGNVHDYALCLNLWIDLCETVSGNLCLEVVISATVLKRKETLSNRIAIADSTVVHEGHLCEAPAQQIPRNLAAERARSEQQTLCFFQDFKIEFWSLSPLHKF